MSKNRINYFLAMMTLSVAALGCSSLERFGSQTQSNASMNQTPAKSSPNQKSVNQRATVDDDAAASTSGAEKVKPAAGKGNVQGKVFYNDQPAAGIEIKICGEFSTLLGVECTGKTKTAKTDADGVFVIADLDPMVYQGLTAKVFDTDYYIFPQEGIMTPQKFDVQAAQTIFARDINLFKDDLKLTNPKAGAKVEAKDVRIKWQAYPGASYYKVSLFAANPQILSTVVGERVEDPAFTPPQMLVNDTYRISVEAYSSGDHKISQSSDEIKFTVTGGETPPVE